MTFDNFKKLRLQIWQDIKHSFLVIDKTNDLKNGRFRKGFDKYYINS